MNVLKQLPSSPKYLTLVLVREAGRVLLGLKKRGFGAGYLNGFGGKVEHGESIVQAAARELHEESGLTAKRLDWRGVLTFNFDDNPQPWEVHVFTVAEGQYTGEPSESEEMAPVWTKLDEIPYDRMWEDDQHWHPLLLAGKRFRGTFDFADTHTLVRHSLSELEEGEPGCEYVHLPLDRSGEHGGGESGCDGAQ